MRAVLFNEYGGPDLLHVGEIEVFGFAVGGGGAENALPDRDAGKPAGLSWAEAAALPAAAIWRQLA